MTYLKTLASALALSALALALPAQADTPAALLAGYSAAAKAAADPARGQQFFTSTHGREWSCSSCHGAVPVKEGKHASTGKLIQPMAPAFNAERFTDSAKTEKWFRRNCNDVVGRECTPGEKADLIAWLLTLKA
jgi:mono/diheme cytochrome c family protein